MMEYGADSLQKPDRQKEPEAGHVESASEAAVPHRWKGSTQLSCSCEPTRNPILNIFKMVKGDEIDIRKFSGGAHKGRLLPIEVWYLYIACLIMLLRIRIDSA